MRGHAEQRSGRTPYAALLLPPKRRIFPAAPLTCRAITPSTAAVSWDCAPLPLPGGFWPLPPALGRTVAEVVSLQETDGSIVQVVETRLDLKPERLTFGIGLGIDHDPRQVARLVEGAGLGE